MSPTIKDVAKRAGVAVSTVSLVVNQKSNVSMQTREKVLHAIKDLNYHPRRSARGLVTRRSGNIGFILTEDHFSLAEPFYTKIFLGTEFEARKYDYYVLLTTIESSSKVGLIPRFLLERNVDGVILAGSVPTKLIEDIRNRNLPLVLVDYFPPRGRYSTVLIDNINGARQATEYLIKQGHTSIAFIGGDMEHPSLYERYEGYKKALKDANLPIRNELVHIKERYTGINDGYDAAEHLLKARITFSALFAANDALAVGALRCFREYNILVPDNIAIIGFDDVEIATNFHPKLSTMSVPKEEMGALALRRVVEMINSNDISISQTIIPVKLIPRESS